MTRMGSDKYGLSFLLDCGSANMELNISSHFFFCRYSAIRCASAVPMSSLELQQSREMQRAPEPEPVVKKPAMNGEANAASKPSTKPQKGIMGMFASKPAPKNQDSSKEVKSEQKEDAPVVRRWSPYIKI